MASGSAGRAAAVAGWLFFLVPSAAHSAEPHPASGDTASRPSAKAPTKSTRGIDLGARRAIAGGPTADDVLASAESPDLRALREAELELFPSGSSDSQLSWTGDSPLLLPGGPRVVATGLPPGAPAIEAERPRGDAAWLEHLELPDLPIRWDERVLRYLVFFRDDPHGRTTFANLYRHSGRWRDMIRQVLHRRSLPVDLAWISMIESGFDPTAHSSAGAAGLWQLMPETAKIYGLVIDHWLDQRLSPTLATQAAAALLDDLHRRFGSWDLALAAFNMGHAGLASVVRRYNTNDFWSLAHTEGTLPWETTLYVPKVLAAAVISHNLAAFGFADLLVDPPAEADEVDVAASTSLALVAQAAGCSVRDIEALNPELRAARTPPAGETEASYPVRLPVGKRASMGPALARLRRDQPVLEHYVVRFGETLEQVATARHTTAAKLVDLNAIAPGEIVRGGTTLLVPGLAPSPAASSPVTAKPSAVVPSPVTPKPSVVVPSDVFLYPNHERVFYRVVALDTLKDIAAALHVSQDELRRWNDLDAGARLQEGMTLQAYVPRDADLSGVVVLGEKDVHVLPVGSEDFFAALEQEKRFKRTTVSAQAGDTVESIGKHFSVPARTMERINRRPRADVLKAGETVVVYVPASKAQAAPRAAVAVTGEALTSASTPAPSN